MEDEPQPSRLAAQQTARWAGNVALRFEAYDYAKPPFDIYTAIYDRLYLRGYELIVDVGSNDGKFVHLLKDRIGEGPFFNLSSRMRGQIIGVEPNAAAVEHLRRSNNSRIRFFKGSAEELPGASKSVDVVTANFMMYFAQDIDACFREFLRVLKDDGKFVLSTSGYFNKPRQRVFEEVTARNRNRKSPKRMNESFDTDIALEVLPKYFSHIYHGSYHGKMIFRDEDEAMAYFHSMLSMGEFFDPPMSNEEMEGAYDETVAQIVRREIETFGYFQDYVQRDFFICSNDPLGLRIYDPSSDDIRNITGYEIEQLGEDYSKF